MNSYTLIDHRITNSPDKIAKSGAVHLAISDHALIYMTHKAEYERSGARIIKTRYMKNFRKSSYLRDLQQKAWSDIETLNDPNDMWSMWKDMLMQSIDKYAPLRSKRVGNKKALWITDHLRREMHSQERFLKKRKPCWTVNSQHGPNTNDPGTRQIAKLGKPNVNTSLTT